MFIDEAIIDVRGGRGGDGCVSFRREKYVPRGGPDGGDGGDGGSVIIRAVAGMNTLLEVSRRRRYEATPGAPGSGARKTGRSGEDVVLEVPPGTVVFDIDRGVMIKDLAEAGGEAPVARGGRGGQGNTAFVSSTNRAPRESTPGGEGESRRLRLELHLVGDVGLVGMPNAGKSTILSRVSAARPKIADYPFTTIAPLLGIVDAGDYRTFVMADIPGLIEGAHAGSGLGDRFLRHIERTRILVHVVDAAPMTGDPVEAYQTVERELALYSQGLAAKERIIFANKTDLPGSAAGIEALRAATGREVIAGSAVTGEGLKTLIGVLCERVFPLDRHE